MTRDVATVSLHADVSEAATIMATRLVRRLPVVDDLQHIYGVVVVATDDANHYGRRPRKTFGSRSATWGVTRSAW